MRAISTPKGTFFYDHTTGTCLFTNTKKSDKWQTPLHAQIALTQRCNLRCWHCYTTPTTTTSNRSYEWPIDRLKRLIQYLDGWGVFGVAFGGGEPFLYPYLQEITKHTWTQTRLDTSITTNGYAATSEQISALEGYVSEIRVSIRNLSDCSQLAKFLGRDFEVGVNLLLYRENVSTLVDIVERCKSLGVWDFLVNSFVATGQGASFVDKIPTETDFTEFSKKVIGKYVGAGLTFKVSGRLATCLEPYLDCEFVPFHSETRGQILSITFDGKLKPTSLSNETYPFQHETQIADIYRQKIAINPVSKSTF